MHSIVIHFGKKYEDWHLVEPFFYKLQNNKELTFYWEDEEASVSNPLFFSLVDRIIEHLDCYRIKDWQMIVLHNLYDERNRRGRLTTKISEIRAKLLNPLKDKGVYPLQTILHLVDMINRNSDYSPKDEILRKHWELDHYGYLLSVQADSRSGNAFTNDEIKRLDQEWGGPLNLQNIVLDQPSISFMDRLNQKCFNVTNCLTNLIKRKKEEYRNAGESKNNGEWMSDEQLQSVLKDFKMRLKQISKLPLTQSLNSFTPSKELSSSLKYYVGIQGEIGDIRLVRHEIASNSHRERMKGYLELTYFLLTISSHPKLIERMEKGSMNAIQFTLDEERLEKLLKNYFMSLLMAKRQLEDQLLLQNQFHTNRLKEYESTPYTASSIEKKSGENHLLSMRKRMTGKFFDQWQDQVFKAETILIDRERDLLRNSKEAIYKLNVLKRKNEFLIEEELVEINDYKQELDQQIGLVHQGVINSAPSLSEALSTWRNHVTEAKKKMHFLLQHIPNQRQFLTLSFLIFLILIVPFLHLWSSNSPQSGRIYYYFIFLVLMVLVLYLGYLFTKRSSYRPIWKLQEATHVYTENIFQMQVDSQYQYNHFLNHLFQLFLLRKYHEKVSSIGEERKEDNILHRYHLIKLEEFVQMTNRLLHILQVNKEQNSTIQDLKIPTIKYEKSVIENPIYSPFQQLGRLEPNLQGIEVYLGSAREQYQSTYINELNQIRIQEDKVYKL